jgi:hypothetical protein
MTLIESEQSKDIRLTQVTRGPFMLRFASYRKSEDAKLHLRSEDYIVSELIPEKAVFALCDGVGSSYYGNIGSQFLGETLLNWLGNIDLPDSSKFMNEKITKVWLENLNTSLKKELDLKADFATSIINSKASPDQSELVQLAERTQRDDFGTQSNFVGGIIWPKTKNHPNGLVLLFWLGNARIKIFNELEDLTDLTKWGENPEQLKEVWSSKEGVVGHIYSYLTDFSKITRILAYSDGLEDVEDRLIPNLQGGQLEELVRQAQSIKDDDISFLEIFLSEDNQHEYSNDIVSKVRHQYSHSQIPAVLQAQQKGHFEVKENHDKPHKEKRTQSKFSKLAKLFGGFIIIISLITSFGLGLVLGDYFRVLEKISNIVLPTSHAPTPTFFQSPPTQFVVPSSTPPPPPLEVIPPTQPTPFDSGTQDPLPPVEEPFEFAPTPY